MKRFKLTAEEKAYEREFDGAKPLPPSDPQFRAIVAAIERRRKNAVLNIRVNQQDLDSLKKKARRLGVPYQTMIAELLHHFAA